MAYSKKISGIYKITCTPSGKFYIGSAMNIRERWRNHRSYLRAQKHVSRHMQRAWSKYGEQCFAFEIVEVCEAATLLEREQFYLDTLQPFGSAGFNTARVAGSNSGVKRTPEQIERMAAFHRGKKLSPEHRARLSAVNRGRKHSEETKALLSRIRTLNNWQRGRPASAKQKAGIPAGPNHPNRGRRRSEEWKRRLSIKKSKAIIAVKDGKEVMGFRTVRDAMQFCGLKTPEDIRRLANGDNSRCRMAGGYAWRWANCTAHPAENIRIEGL